MNKIERKTYLYKEIVKGLKSSYVDSIVITRKTSKSNKKSKSMYAISSNLKENEEIYLKLFKDKTEYIYLGDMEKTKFYGKEYIKGVSLTNGTNIYFLFKKNIPSKVMKYICVCVAISFADYIVVNKIDNISNGLEELDVALELGKEIYAIPGNIFEYKNYLSNFAIKQGAIPICSIYDVKHITKNN